MKAKTARMCFYGTPQLNGDPKADLSEVDCRIQLLRHKVDELRTINEK
jgi:hypothetical protein